MSSINKFNNLNCNIFNFNNQSVLIMNCLKTFGNFLILLILLLIYIIINNNDQSIIECQLHNQQQQHPYHSNYNYQNDNNQYRQRNYHQSSPLSSPSQSLQAPSSSSLSSSSTTTTITSINKKSNQFQTPTQIYKIRSGRAIDHHNNNNNNISINNASLSSSSSSSSSPTTTLSYHRIIPLPSSSSSSSSSSASQSTSIASVVNANNQQHQQQQKQQSYTNNNNKFHQLLPHYESSRLISSRSNQQSSNNNNNNDNSTGSLSSPPMMMMMMSAATNSNAATATSTASSTTTTSSSAPPSTTVIRHPSTCTHDRSQTACTFNLLCYLANGVPVEPCEDNPSMTCCYIRLKNPIPSSMTHNLDIGPSYSIHPSQQQPSTLKVDSPMSTGMMSTTTMSSTPIVSTTTSSSSSSQSSSTTTPAPTTIMQQSSSTSTTPTSTTTTTTTIAPFALSLTDNSGIYHYNNHNKDNNHGHFHHSNQNYNNHNHHFNTPMSPIHLISMTSNNNNNNDHAKSFHSSFRNNYNHHHNHQHQQQHNHQQHQPHYHHHHHHHPKSLLSDNTMSNIKIHDLDYYPSSLLTTHNSHQHQHQHYSHYNFNHPHHHYHLNNHNHHHHQSNYNHHNSNNNQNQNAHQSFSNSGISSSSSSLFEQSFNLKNNLLASLESSPTSYRNQNEFDYIMNHNNAIRRTRPDNVKSVFQEIVNRKFYARNYNIDDICGKPMSKPRSRIIGGQDAYFGEFPWQVHIKITKHQCGGALVNSRFIVTAAHCIYQAPIHQLNVIIGAHDIEDHRFQDIPPQYFRVSRVILHPNFRFSASHPDRYDVALIKLDSPVRFSDSVLPVCLPIEENFNFEGRKGVVTGWGKTDPALSNRYGTRLLQKVDVPIIDNEKCEAWHRTRGIDLRIFSEMMCAGYEDGQKDACVGDSGGPLVINLNGRWTLAGITSAGFGCAQSRQPGIYHRVANTVEWIRQTLRDEEEKEKSNML